MHVHISMPIQDFLAVLETGKARSGSDWALVHKLLVDHRLDPNRVVLAGSLFRRACMPGVWAVAKAPANQVRVAPETREALLQSVPMWEVVHDPRTNDLMQAKLERQADDVSVVRTNVVGRVATFALACLMIAMLYAGLSIEAATWAIVGLGLALLLVARQLRKRARSLVVLRPFKPLIVGSRR